MHRIFNSKVSFRNGISINLLIAIVVFALGFGFVSQQNQYLKTSTGTVEFMSDAPLELITAKSEKLNGILSISNSAFAFELAVSSFEGFNSPLQAEHFYENYMQIDRYPTATFTGKIIEFIDFQKTGKIKVRAKGKFTIHGIEKEIMVEINLQIKEESIVADSEFDILLEDYKIKIPKIVNKKIANTIHIAVHAELK